MHTLYVLCTSPFQLQPASWVEHPH